MEKKKSFYIIIALFSAKFTLENFDRSPDFHSVATTKYLLFLNKSLRPSFNSLDP